MEWSEPWDAVRVRVAVSRDIAARLRQLTRQCDPALRSLGVLSVCVGGAGVGSTEVPDNVGDSLSQVSSAVNSRNSSVTGVVQPSLTSGLPSNLRQHSHHPLHHHHQHPPSHPSHHHHHPHHHHNLHHHPQQQQLQQQQLQQRLQTTAGLQQRVTTVQRTVPSRQLQLQQQQQSQQQQLIHYCEPPAPSGSRPVSAVGTDELLSTTVSPSSGMIVNGVLTHASLPATIAATTTTTKLPVAVRTGGPLSAAAAPPPTALHPTHPSLQRHPAAVQRPVSPPPPYPGTAAASSSLAPVDVVPPANPAVAVSSAAIGSPLLVNLLKSDVSPLESVSMAGLTRVSSAVRPSSSTSCSTSSSSSVSVASTAAVTPSALHQQLLRSRLQHPAATTTTATGTCQLPTAPLNVSATSATVMATTTTTTTPHRVYSAHLFQLRRSSGNVGVQIKHSDPLTQQQQQQQLRISQSQYQQQQQNQPQQQCAAMAVSSASLRLQAAGCSVGEAARSCASVSTATSNTIDSCSGDSVVSGSPLSQATSTCSTGTAGRLSSSTPALTSSNSALPVVLSTPYFSTPSSSSSSISSAVSSQPTVKPCQLLINPLTGLLEPMAPSDDSESELELPVSQLDVAAAGSFPSSSLSSSVSTCGVVSVSTCLPLCATPAAAASSSLSSVAATTVVGGGTACSGNDAGDFRVRLKHDKLSATTTTLAYDTALTEPTPASLAVAALSAGCMGVVPMLNGSDSLLARSGGDPEQRVPPLHISLRGGRNAAIVVTTKDTPTPPNSTASCTAAASFHTNTAVTCSSTIVNAVGTPHLQHHQQHHQQSSGRGGKSRSVSRVLCASESVSCGIDGTNSAPGAGKSSVSIGVSVGSVSPVSHVAVSGGSAAAVRNRCVRDKVKRQKKREEDDSGAADQPQQQQRRLLSCRVVDSLVESRMPATNHVLDLHSDLDLKHVPPMPPEDIFSPDVWMTPGQSSDDVAAQQRFAADNTLCVKTSIPIASADRTTTTATAITSLSTALMSSKHTDLSTVSTCALTPAVVSTVARVTAPVSASSAATAVAGGGGDDSGIESMDTQSEESPNQGESPQHRKEELDSEKHDGVLSRELHLLARRSASIDELDLPVSSTQRRSVVVTTPASPNSSTARISSSPSTSTVVLNGPSNDISLSADRLSPAMVQLSRDSKTPQASVSSAPTVHSPALSALLSLPLVSTSLAPSRLSAVSARPDSVASSTASEPVCVGRLQTVSVWHDSCTTTGSTTDSLSPTPPVSAVAATNKLATSDRLMNSPQDASTTLAASAAVGLLHTNVSTYASVGCSSGDQSRSVATSQCFRTLVDTDDRSATLQDTLDAADDAVSDGNGQFSGVVASVECDATTISTDTTTTTTTTAANAGSDVCTRVETPVADSIAVSSKVESIGGEPATCIENNSSSSSTSVISGEFCLVSQPAGTAAITGAVPPASTINCSPSIGVSRGFTALSVGGSACGSPVPPLTLPPGVKMLPIKLIKAPTVVASAGTVARSVSVSLPASTTTSSVLSAPLLPLVTSATCSRVDLSLVSTVSAAPSNSTSSSALTTDGADSGCTENNSSSNSTRSSSSGCVSVSSRSSTAPVADCTPPSSLSSTEPELLRVQPPLYTYSNVERIQRSASPAEATLFLSERVADVNSSSSSSSSSSPRTLETTTTTSSATAIADTAVVDSVSTTCRSVTPGECSDTAAAVSATTTPDATAATSISPATTSSSVSSASTVVSTVSTTASSLEPLQSGDVDRRCTRSTTSRLHCVTTTTTAAVAMSVAVSSRASNARALRSHTDTLANCIDGSTIATAAVTTPTAITTANNNSNGDSDLRCRSPSMVVGGGDSPITAASVVVNRSTAQEDGSTPVRTQVNGSVSTVPAVPLFSVRPTVTNSAGRGAKRDVGAALGSSDDTDRPNTRSVGDQSGVIPTSSSSSSCTPATNSSASTGNSGSTSSSGVGENDSNSHLSNCSSLAADSDHSCKPAATDSTTTTSSSCLPDENNCDHQPMSAVVGVRQNSAASCDSVVLEQTALAPNDNHVDTGVSGQARNNNSTKSSTAIGRLSRAKARGAKFAAVSSDSFLAPTPPAPPPPPTAAVSVAPAPVPLPAATAVTRRGRALLARKQQQQLQLGGEEVGSEDVVASGGVSSATAVVPGKRKLRNNSQLPVVVANHSLDSVAEVHLSAKRRRSSRDK